MRVYSSASDLLGGVGEQLGVSEWFLVDQGRVDNFAKATNDHQWIHVDVDRAMQGPYGGTIAHGLLTLSLMPALMRDTYRIENASMGLNYGYGKVRFLSPVPVGRRIRARVALVGAEESGSGIRTLFEVTVEIEGESKAACFAESISLWMF